MFGTVENNCIAEVKFIAEGSLSSLVKNLRILGIDCQYDGGLSAVDAINLAIRSSRILVTRRNIPQTTRLRVHRVIGDSTREQLSSLVSAFNLELFFQPFSRCLECNEPLQRLAVSSESVEWSNLPESVKERGVPLYQCRLCRKLFWHGSHIERMIARLKEWGIDLPQETFKGV